MLQNYPQLVERIARSAKLSVEDIERRVEAKRAKLSGLISKEGAAQVVAAELGISFEKERMKISEVMSGMKRVNLVGKIIRMFQVREYNKNGRSGKIGSFIIADDSSNIRMVLWDTHHIALIEKGEIKEGDVVEVSNASVRNQEIHLTGFSDIKLSSEVLDNVKTEQSFCTLVVKELKQGQNARVRAVIVRIFDPRFFNVCPECKKKVSEAGECGEHGKVSPEKRYLISIVLDDGSESIRAVLFSEQADKFLGEGTVENSEVFFQKRDQLLGSEMYFSGQVRQNKIYDTLEFFVQDTVEVDIDKLIAELEGKQKS